jgi:hypothetical protein
LEDYLLESWPIPMINAGMRTRFGKNACSSVQEQHLQDVLRPEQTGQKDAAGKKLTCFLKVSAHFCVQLCFKVPLSLSYKLFESYKIHPSYTNIVKTVSVNSAVFIWIPRYKVTIWPAFWLWCSKAYLLVFLFIFSFWGAGAWTQGLHLSHSTSPLILFFCDEYFQDRASWTIYPGWLWTAILLISASWVARITSL